MKENVAKIGDLGSATTIKEKPEKKEEDEINSYSEDSENFFGKCYQDGDTYKYRFNKNSTLLGTIYENLFNKKCEDYFKNKKKQSKFYRIVLK